MSTSAAEGDCREVLALRRSIYSKGDATRADLEKLIARGRQGGGDPEFCNLIAESPRACWCVKAIRPAM
jgi:hypothetical protein